MKTHNVLLLLSITAHSIILMACGGDPDITINGPTTLDHGVAKAYSVKYKMTSTQMANTTHKFTVEEDDTIDDTLVTSTTMTIQAGNTTGTSASFNLTCSYDGANWDLTGPNGNSQDENPHQVHAELIHTGINTSGVNKDITCQGAGGKPDTLRIINRFGDQRTTMTSGVSETFTIELKMTDKVLTAESFTYDVIESDNPIDGTFWSETLEKKAKVTVPAGSKIGTGTFKLTCNPNGANWDLVGVNDTSKDEVVHQLWANGTKSEYKDSYAYNTDAPIRFHVVHCQAAATEEGGSSGSSGSSTGTGE